MLLSNPIVFISERMASAMNKQELWRRYQKYLSAHPAVGLTLDVSSMNFPHQFLEEMASPMQQAFEQMDALENGSIANADENRMVGHYWLRHPALAPSRSIQTLIENNISEIKNFSGKIHEGILRSPKGDPFRKILLVGIGGSALGPQFIHQALGVSENRMAFYCLDNTDPDGMDLLFADIGPHLSETLVMVISKSGGTIETRNGMREVEAAYQRAGLEFAGHAVAITGPGSALEEKALAEGWLDIFPMWEWVGGRTSLFSAVGLLPASLEGIEIDGLLRGAANMDQVTRQSEIRLNPSALLALMWYYAGEGKGNKNMVILPYKDRLAFLSRYLQQLIMESLGKEKNISGEVVHQGITVYGNKGATDQHAFLQQLREGKADFFVTFIQVLQERISPPPNDEEKSISHPHGERPRENSIPLPLGEGQTENNIPLPWMEGSGEGAKSGPLSKSANQESIPSSKDANSISLHHGEGARENSIPLPRGEGARENRIPLPRREGSGEGAKSGSLSKKPDTQPSITTGDFLQGFLLGTEEALHENGRDSMTITLDAVNATTIGALIALYERAVGIYASLVQINAYHQPGVEAGKKAANNMIELQAKILQFLQSHPGEPFTLQGITTAIDHPDDCRTSFKILEYLTRNERNIFKIPGKTYFEGTYGYKP